MLFTPSQISVLVLALLSTPALAVKNLSVKVEGPASVQDVDNFVIKTVLSNTGDEILTLLKDPESILTPNLKTNVFGITNANGTPAKFDGVKVKWSPSIAINNKEFTVLNPGQSITIEQDLSGTYNLTDSRAGLYTIDAKKEFTLFENGKISKISASDAGVHTLSVEGALSSKIAAARHAASAEALRKRQTYSGCTSSRQSSIASAVPSAQTYINNAISYLNGISSGTTRYTTWFGSYTSSRKSTVLSHYNNMSGDPAAALYDCACTDSSYAYVYPNQPYHIWFCNAFWSAPTTGTDSKAGTIVHELSHFTVNGGTNDYAYGQSAAKNLAINNPSQAIMNADSHEYFAENTPSLP